MSETGLLVEPLLEELEHGYDRIKVTALGGGHGLAAALRAILDYADTVTAIVTVADNGGSSGRLAPQLDIPPPGDIRRSLLALADRPSLWRSLVEYRFEGSDVAGHSLGNLIIAALADLGGGFSDAVDTLGRLLGARGTVVPVAERRLDLEALIDGTWVRGQAAIAAARGRVTDLRVTPEVKANGPALEAILAADQIVLGPGSLYTSVSAVLAVPGVAAAVTTAGGTLVYVCNLTTQDGETLGMSGMDHLEALTSVGGIRTPDVVVAHDGPLDVPEGLQQVRLQPEDLASMGIRLETGEIARPDAPWPEHDPARLGALLRRLA